MLHWKGLRMNRFKRIALKVLSYSRRNLKKYYKFQRKLLNVFNIYLGPKYGLLDHKIMVGDREIPVRIFRPINNETSGVMIFFHGGGWVTGNIDTYTNVCVNMANQTRNTIISVDYRLAPEHPFPLGLEDCYNATAEIFHNLDLLNCKESDITLIGDSAGGNLAAAVSLLARDRGDFLPSKQILIYPATYNDHTENSPFLSIKENGRDYLLTSRHIQDYMDLYAPNIEDRSSPYLAPLLAKDMNNQPDTLIITAQYDPLRDEGEAYGMRLKQAGNRVKMYRLQGAVHGFFSLPWKSEYVTRSYNIINCFINSCNGRSEELL